MVIKHLKSVTSISKEKKGNVVYNDHIGSFTLIGSFTIF
ncbi:uncharacterized protein METZ01_LOCUS389250 [marine metagenome]|uniref:Uncharacterized protein n=1 Tax=marine metagenome TaxID=408172 RepID=A0A382UQ62_9ZZZZ